MIENIKSEKMVKNNGLGSSKTSLFDTAKKSNIINKNSGSSARKSVLMNDEYDSSEVSINASPATVKKSKKVKKDDPVLKRLFKNKLRYKKDGSLRSKFGDFNFKPNQSIFDAEIIYGSNFFGFYVAIWVCIGFFGLNVTLNHYQTGGSLLRSEIMQIMMRDLWKIALTDLAMYLSLYFSVLIQFAVKNNLIKWKPLGHYLQTIYEVFLLVFSIYWSQHMDYPWIGQIFLMLHAVVMLMKVHSYAFSNGYLWDITDELKFSKKYLKKHENLEDATKKAFEQSVEFCNFELSCHSFPNNISFYNFFEYSMFPCLVYETSYPRTETINTYYLFQKIAGIFGVILLMVAISQHHLYPITMKCLELQKNPDVLYKLKIYPLILIETIPPFLSVYILVFYLIWELILNAIAELSFFADREFYRYWWNSVDWNEYARDWNTPVHKFLLRHVYHSSISAFHVNKTTATFMTFFLSSLVHELAMFVIFKKVRFYLLMLQMSQLSLVQLSRTKFMKDKKVLGNCIFWFGIVFGPSLMCTMYLVF